MPSQIDQAVSRFEQGFVCSQAVLSAYAPQLGLERELALRIAAPFGGGIARMGQMCGAVTGALLSIGFRHGYTTVDDEETKEQCYAIVREFIQAFEARHGSITCKELLGCDISTPKGRTYAQENNLFVEICPKLVQDAAEIVGELLE